MIWQTFIGYAILIVGLLVLAAIPYLLHRAWRCLKASAWTDEHRGQVRSHDMEEW